MKGMGKGCDWGRLCHGFFWGGDDDPGHYTRPDHFSKADYGPGLNDKQNQNLSPPSASHVNICLILSFAVYITGTVDINIMQQ